MKEGAQYWLALTRIQGLGTRGALRLVKAFGSPERVYAASLTELEACGLTSRVAQDLFAQKGLEEADKEIHAAAKLGVEIVTPSAGDYPPLLWQIPDPPLAVYVQGDVAAIS
ncbi:MAG: DNA-processing protein DprA, partial [Terriglobia bacterium]